MFDVQLYSLCFFVAVLPAPYPYGGDEIALYSRLPNALILRLGVFVAKKIKYPEKYK